MYNFENCWSCGRPGVWRGFFNLCAECFTVQPQPAGAMVAEHNLAFCWRCQINGVDPEDDLGLCDRCKTDLGAKIPDVEFAESWENNS